MWQMNSEGAQYPFLLTGWFKLSDDAVSGIAHVAQDYADVTRIGIPEGAVGEFVVEDVPIHDFLDLWLKAEDIEPLRRAVCPGRALEPEKPLGTRERRTLLTLIGVLCSANDIDLAKPSKAAGVVAALADRQGLRISQRAIENHLKVVDEAIDSRQSA